MIQPIFDPNRGWREWFIGEIYTGPAGTGAYVPNVDDKVWSWVQGIMRVVAVDLSTGLSTLQAWEAPAEPEPENRLDILSGVGPGYSSESWRMMLDTSVFPYRLQFDDRLHAYSSTTSYCKVFLGSDIGPQGKVISKYFDQSGNFISDNIPLEVVAMPDGNNYAIKAPKTGYCTERYPDGELVTAVFYNDSGGVSSKAQLLVWNTSFIRAIESPERYITSVEILSPFKSAVDPQLIEFPINVTLASVTMMAQVNYTDGRRVIAVDGDKVQLLGLENYVSTINGQQVPIFLRYALSPGESSFHGVGVGEKVVMTQYRAKTTPVDGAYSVKLFCCPHWDYTLNRYRLAWYLYNLNRETYYRVDDLVELAVTSNPFMPTLYGQSQDITVSLDLSRVNPLFAKYRHVQNVRLTLFAAGTATQTLWTVHYDTMTDTPYGAEVYATMQHISGFTYRARLNDRWTNVDAWLERFYYQLLPVTNPDVEPRPPRPTHFVVDAHGVKTEYPLNAFSAELTIPAEVKNGQNLYLHWIKRDGGNDLQLGVSAVTARHL